MNLEQLLCYTFSSLLIVMIAVLCLKLSANTITVFPRKSNIAIKLNKSLAEHTSCTRYSNNSGLLSTSYAYTLVLKQMADGQVYTPDKMKEKASNIKKNLSLAIFKIVTARC